MIERKTQGKEYVLGELEKLTADSDYYMKSASKTREFIDRTSGLMEKLKAYELENAEKKHFWRALKLINKLRRILK